MRYDKSGKYDECAVNLALDIGHWVLFGIWGLGNWDFDDRMAADCALLLIAYDSTMTIPPHIKGLIFDCDGTIADTMPLHYRAWVAALGEHGVEFPEALFYDMAGIPTPRIIEILNQRLWPRHARGGNRPAQRCDV